MSVQLGRKLSEISDAIIDPIVAIITLVVFAIIIPIIVDVLKAITSAQAAIGQVGSQVQQLAASQQTQQIPGYTFVSGQTSRQIGRLVYNAQTNSYRYEAGTR